MKTTTSIMSGLAASILIAGLAGTALSQDGDDAMMEDNTMMADDMAPFGGAHDVDFALTLWDTMTEARLVGEGRIVSRPFEGSEPHGAIQEVVATTIEMEGRSGRLLVKQNHVGEGADRDSVYENPEQWLDAVTIMFKREDGYDSDNQDWFWAKYLPDGTLDQNPAGVQLAGRVAKGMDAGCIACHTAAGGADLEVLTFSD